MPPQVSPVGLLAWSSPSLSLKRSTDSFINTDSLIPMSNALGNASTSNPVVVDSAQGMNTGKNISTRVPASQSRLDQVHQLGQSSSVRRFHQIFVHQLTIQMWGL